jgi:hypothetical protein
VSVSFTVLNCKVDASDTRVDISVQCQCRRVFLSFEKQRGVRAVLTGSESAGAKGTSVGTSAKAMCGQPSWPRAP